MDMKLDEMLAKILDYLNSSAKTETVMGEPFQLGEFTCVPIVRIGMGFGSGGGGGAGDKKGETAGGAAGAGLGIEPVGFLVTRGEEISILQVGKNKGIQAIFEKVPDLLEKLLELKDKRGKEKQKK
ncbi:MAG: hypothetical protein KAT48_09160 [Bacteroidales bacterium]|nr:hypothetical protein [Bacteroidales bacterium]